MTSSIGREPGASAKVRAYDRSCRQATIVAVVGLVASAFALLEVHLRADSVSSETLLWPILWLSASALVATGGFSARLVLGGLRDAAQAELLDEFERGRAGRRSG